MGPLYIKEKLKKNNGIVNNISRPDVGAQVRKIAQPLHSYGT
jgi:hypothetical protein